MAAALTLEGDKQLIKKFDRLERTVKKRIGRRALAAGSTPVMKEMRRRAPVGPTVSGYLPGYGSFTKKGGNLKRSIGRKVKTYREGVVVAYVGPRVKTGKFAGPHAHLTEFGTKPRWHKSGKFVGATPARPWMRPAWDATKGLALRLIRQKMRQEIEKEAKKK